MDPLTGFRVGSTILMLLIFLGIVWWALGGGRRTRFDHAAHSVLQDDDAPDSLPGQGRIK